MTKEFLESTIAKPDPKHKVYVCGPPGMMKAITGKSTRAHAITAHFCSYLAQLSYLYDEYPFFVFVL
jgi:NAD(P)H-flavin reductase